MFSIRDIDSGVIFEKYTISEIVDIEKKIRQDIEKKKEDLRIMVGERYRDLIEAADTITKMRDGSAQITESILNIENLCSSMSSTNNVLNRITPINPKMDDKTNHENLKFINAFIKLLMDAPELIWRAIEEQHYLEASKIYLIIKQLNTNFEKDEFKGIMNFQFPLIKQQLANIDHIGVTIVKNCIDCITAVNKDKNVTSECIVSIVLLTGKQLQLFFNEFIQIRIKAITNILVRDSSSISIKEEIIELVTIALVTIHQLQSIFAPESEKEEFNLKSLLQDISKDDCVTNNYLKTKFPDAIAKDFKLNLKADEIILSKTNLESGIDDFFQSYEELVTKYIPDLLCHIQNMKNLSNIRQEIINLVYLQYNSNIPLNDSNIWVKFFRRHFLLRVKVISDASFESLLNLITTNIDQLLEQNINVNKKFILDCDPSSYIWSESSSDLSGNVAWIPVTQRPKANILEMNALQFKCKAITPSIQSLCCMLEEEMKKLQEDVHSYTQSLNTLTLNITSLKASETLMIESDALEVANSFKASCETFLQSLLEFLKSKLLKYDEIMTKNDTDIKDFIDRILILGRLASTLCKYNETFSSIIVEQNNTDIPKKPKADLPIEETRWKKWVDKLDEFTNTTYSYWRELIVSNKILKLENDLMIDSEESAVIRSISLCTQWDAIEIEEEDEQGTKIKSTIRVPMQISTSLHVFFFEISKDCNRVSAHSFPTSAIQKLRQFILSKLIDTYFKIINKSKTSTTKLLQNESLQLLFDVKFFSTMLVSSDRKEPVGQLKIKIQELLDEIESNIDPFDLDVFRPHLDKHFSKALQKSCILYGILFLGNSLMLHSNVTGSSQESHNILPLTNCQVRFLTLPINIHNKFNPNRSDIKLKT